VAGEQARQIEIARFMAQEPERVAALIADFAAPQAVG
jgi:hypothetical protein